MSRSKSTPKTLNGKSRESASARITVGTNFIKVIVLLGFIALGQGSLPAQCVIQGRILNPVSGTAVRKAEVILRRSDDQVNYQTVSDADGHYKLSGIAAGRYLLFAQRPGFAPRRRWFRLCADDSQGTLNLELFPPAAITGHVYNEDGEPLKIPVQLWRETLRRGFRQLIEAGSYPSEGGEYRFFGLSPGRYFVSTAQTPIRAGGVLTREAYAQTFYSNAVTLALGGEARNIDFHLRRSPTATISLTVVGTKDPDQNVAITLASQEGTANLRANSNAGQFKIDGLTPGSYTLTATSEDEDRHYFARMKIEVGTLDLEGLRIELAPMSEVSAKLRFEASRLEGGPPPRPVGLTLLAADPAVPSATALPDDSGTYTWTNLIAGTWTVGPPDSTYVKSPREIEIGPDRNGPFEIVASFRVARIEGKVDFPDDVAAVRVILINAAGRVEKNVPANGEGSFAITGIAPGKYKLVAVEDNEDATWRSPETLASAAGKAVAVELPEAETVHKDLTLIR